MDINDNYDDCICLCLGNILNSNDYGVSDSFFKNLIHIAKADG